MSARPRVLLAVVLVAVSGCRRSAPPLDEVQCMTYGVKPSIVRLNAYATATFRYRAAAIDRVMASVGAVRPAADAPTQEEEVATGAGGSGSGFIVHPDGLILTSGHVPNAFDGKELIKKLIHHTDHRIIIMPGSGIRSNNIAELASYTGAVELHSSARKTITSEMKFVNTGMQETLQNMSVDEDEISAMKMALNSFGN